MKVILAQAQSMMGIVDVGELPDTEFDESESPRGIPKTPGDEGKKADKDIDSDFGTKADKDIDSDFGSIARENTNTETENDLEEENVRYSLTNKYNLFEGECESPNIENDAQQTKMKTPNVSNGKRPDDSTDNGFVYNDIVDTEHGDSIPKVTEDLDITGISSISASSSAFSHPGMKEEDVMPTLIVKEMAPLKVHSEDGAYFEGKAKVFEV